VVELLDRWWKGRATGGEPDHPTLGSRPKGAAHAFAGAGSREPGMPGTTSTSVASTAMAPAWGPGQGRAWTSALACFRDSPSPS
jgi:hypothetical protein